MSCDFEWDACVQQLLSGVVEAMHAAGVDCVIGKQREQAVEPGDEGGVPVWRPA